MHNLTFIQVTDAIPAICAQFQQIMTQHILEINEHDENPLPEQFIPKVIKSLISLQGPQDRHLELCFHEDQPIGFLSGKIDHPDHKGFIKPGYAYIMDFYIMPQHRRKGYAKSMFLHLEMLFAKHGAKRMWLTADPVTGKPFWEAVGFINTRTKSPENNYDIYEKEISSVQNIEGYS